METKKQDLIVTWLLVDWKSGTENKLFLLSLRNSCDLHIWLINYIPGNWRPWYPLLTPVAYDSNGLREACFPSCIFIAKHCKQLIYVPQLHQEAEAETRRVNGRQTKNITNPAHSNMNRLGHWGGVLSSTAFWGYGKRSIDMQNWKCMHLKHKEWPEIEIETSNTSRRLDGVLDTGSHPWFLSLAEPMLKTVLHHFRDFEEPSFYLMSAKLKLCSHVP